MKRSIAFALALLLCASAGCRDAGGMGEASGPEKPPRQSQSAAGRGEGSYDLPLAPTSSREEPSAYHEKEPKDESDASLPEEGTGAPYGAQAPLPPDGEETAAGKQAAQAGEEASSPGDAGTQLRPAPLSPGGGSYISSTQEGSGAVDAAAFEAELLRLLNEARGAAGVSPLVLNDSMRWAARVRAPEVLQSLSHTRPDGAAYYTAFDETGYAYAGKWHGENVSSMQFTRGMYDTASAAAVMFGELSKSSGHNANMLAGHFSEVGIGVYVLEEDDLVRIGSAQMFAGG